MGGFWPLGVGGFWPLVSYMRRWSKYDMVVATRTHVSQILFAVGHVNRALDTLALRPLKCRV